MTLHRDAGDARAAMARLRRCGGHANPDGTRTDWTIEPLAGIGDEARFVASLRTRDGRALKAANRGVVARAGRAIVWLVDHGPGSRRIATLADVPHYPSYARESARRLAAATWR